MNHPREKVIQRLEPFTGEMEGHDLRTGRWLNGRPRYDNKLDYEEMIFSTATNGTIVVGS